MEKWAIRPAGAPRTKEPGAREDTKESGSRENTKERAKAFGRSMETMPKEISIGTTRRRRN